MVVIPVSDADRSKAFYTGLGWRLDADFSYDNGFRVVQFTPPGSLCSIQFGTKITAAAPGSAHGLYLIVPDIQAGRAELLHRGAKVSEVFHGVRRARNSSPTTPAVASVAPIRIRRATAPLPHSRTPTATAGFFKRSPIGYPVESTRPSRRSAPRANWRARYDVRRQRTASMRSAPARQTPTGPIGTPDSWLPNRPAQSCRHERLRRDRARRWGSQGEHCAVARPRLHLGVEGNS